MLTNSWIYFCNITVARTTLFVIMFQLIWHANHLSSFLYYIFSGSVQILWNSHSSIDKPNWIRHSNSAWKRIIFPKAWVSQAQKGSLLKRLKASERTADLTSNGKLILLCFLKLYFLFLLLRYFLHGIWISLFNNYALLTSSLYQKNNVCSTMKNVFIHASYSQKWDCPS